MIPRKNIVSILLAALMIVSTFTFMIPSVVEASPTKTLYVGGSGPGNYTTIQDAIDNASEGNTVFVYSGTYFENINIHKEIDLIGEDKNTSIIDGGEIGDVINISSNNVTIKSLSIRNSNQTQHNSGIKIYNSTNSTITQCIISRNERGLEILYATNITIVGNTIDSSKKAGVYLVFSDYNIILDNHITTEYVYPWDVPGDTGIDLRYSNNNTISENTLSNTRFGISIDYYSSDNHVAQNILTNHKCGLGIVDSNRNNMSKNTVTNCRCGIATSGGTMNVLWGNTVQDNQRGICHWYNGHNNTISGNTLINNSEVGINLYRESYNTLISCNTLISNKYGIKLDSGYYTTVRDNCFIDDGMYVFNSNQNTIYNNTVNGKPLVYLENISDISIDIDAGQVILNGCENISITNLTLCYTCVGIELFKTHNSTIKNNNISHNDEGIYLCSSYTNVISNNTLSCNHIDGIHSDTHSSGIHSADVYCIYRPSWYYFGFPNNVITGNIITENMGDGINFKYTPHSIITDNFIHSNKNNGIFLKSSPQTFINENSIFDNKNSGLILQNDNNLIVTENLINSNGNNGINITWRSSSNTIEGNTINFNTKSGIYFCQTGYSGSDPWEWHKYGNEIIYNTIQSNKECGIDCKYSNSNKIIRNTISNNGRYGITFGGYTNDNRVHYNNFSNSYQHAYDQGDNLWDDGNHGNYWSDFDEPNEGAYDNNNDGIIDSPYEIHGGSSKDLYPLIRPFSLGKSHKGDSNNDGSIDILDLDAFAQSWASIDLLNFNIFSHALDYFGCNLNYNKYFDFNDDGKIDVFDLDEFAQEWGKKYT